jgi:hypothetical protein
MICLAACFTAEEILDVEGCARGSEGDDALMTLGAGRAIELDAILEAHRHAARASQIDNFLDASAALPASDEDAVEGPSGDESFFDSMNSGKRNHFKITSAFLSPHLKLEPCPIARPAKRKQMAQLSIVAMT